MELPHEKFYRLRQIWPCDIYLPRIKDAFLVFEEVYIKIAFTHGKYDGSNKRYLLGLNFS
jgi:hypothetical protein